jgi:phosphatidylinositol kinase/protein kinase (PI-3  family)
MTRWFFLKHFGPIGSSVFTQAQENFVNSLAGYSLISYLLNVKDRHNGNILIDNQGHLIHIDFGFMLSNAPGGMVGFEHAPFKLTQEYVDVMDGVESGLFQQFRHLWIKGFMALRKYTDNFVLLVEMMQKDSNLPCFALGEQTATSLRERFQLGLTEEQLGQFVDRIITSSYNNLFTRLYDNFQHVTNGIIP